MRIAIVSDIHGNRTAFEAVLADLARTAPDLTVHGGDLADAGSSPAWVVDRIRDLAWPGVAGNTDEMLYRPSSLADYARSLPHLAPLFAAVGEMADATREALGADRLGWLAGLPHSFTLASLTVVHASPGDPWRAPSPQADDAELERVYAPLGATLAVYGHIHRPYQRTVGPMTVANSGSAGLPYDGDPRAAYLLLDSGAVTIRRVEYDVERERKALLASRLPHSEWVAGILAEARPRMP